MKTMVCNKCVNNLKWCYEFKLSLLSSNVHLKPIPSDKNKAEKDFRIQRKDDNGSVDNCTKGNLKCHICNTYVHYGSFNHQQDNKSDVMMSILLKEYFPELGINISGDVSVCNLCTTSLNNYLDIMKTWPFPQDIKEENKMEHSPENDDKQNEYSLEFESPGIEKPDISQIFIIKHEEVDIKMNEDDFDRIEDVNAMASLSNSIDECDLQTDVSINKIEIELLKKQCTLDEHNMAIVQVYETTTYKPNDTIKQTECQNVSINQRSVNRDCSKITVYQCNKCEYKTNRKRGLKRHSIIHQDSSEVIMYCCEKCEYKTRHKYSLKKHFIVHQDSSEVIMYQCEKCDHKTKCKYGLKKHFLVHQDPSEVTMYYCETCEFKTKRKGDLKKHFVIHQGASEVSMYQCENCEYKTSYKSNLKKHIIIYHDSSAVTIYRCEKCKFKNMYKGCLKRHLALHQKTIPK